MVCTRLGSLLRPLFYFLCYTHFSLSVCVHLYIMLVLSAATAASGQFQRSILTCFVNSLVTMDNNYITIPPPLTA